MNALYQAPEPDFDSTTAHFKTVARPRSPLQLVINDIAANPGLTSDRKKMAIDLATDLYSDIQFRCMKYSLAALQILAEERAAGKPAKSVRKDHNSSYTHEIVQSAYALWISMHRDSVVNRVARERSKRIKRLLKQGELADLRKTLRRELRQPWQDIRIACSLVHDLGEDYDVSLARLMTRMNALTGVGIKSPALRQMSRTFDGMTRRRNPDGSKEPVQLYMQRATGDLFTAQCKAHDMMQNNATILRAGVSAEKIEETLRERELFIRLARSKYQDQSVILDYQLSYIEDQLALIRMAMKTTFSNDNERSLLKDRLSDVKHDYRGAESLATEIHPMMGIVSRIEQAIEVQSLDIPPAQDKGPAAALSAPNASDPALQARSLRRA